MRELLSFFIKHSKWFLFALLVTISCMLLFSRNPYQHHVYLTTANSVVASVYKTSSNLTSYFNLRKANNDLNERNAQLQAEVIALREKLSGMTEDSIYGSESIIPDSTRRFSFIVAHVISNSVSKPYNYITINKGQADGLRPEMGVIDQNGVVGIINVTGPHSSRVISLLNPNLQLSCKLKGADNFGSLVWEGNDPKVALLQELPRHTVYQPGDTVVTSGYSAVFPEGVPVGVVLDDLGHKNDNFFTLRIRLFTQFATLSNVQVIVNNQKDELSELEKADYRP